MEKNLITRVLLTILWVILIWVYHLIFTAIGL